MNIRKQKYKSNRILGMNQYNAARAAGYSESYARTHNDKIERATKSDILDALEQAGATVKVASHRLAEALSAKRTQTCDIYIQKDENGEYVINKNSNDFIDVVDYNVRLKSIITFFKLHGLIKEGTDVKVGVRVVNGSDSELNKDDRKHQSDMLAFLENGKAVREGAL